MHIYKGYLLTSEQESDDIVKIGIDHQAKQQYHTYNLHTLHKLILAYVP